MLYVIYKISLFFFCDFFPCEILEFWNGHKELDSRGSKRGSDNQVDWNVSSFDLQFL